MQLIPCQRQFPNLSPSPPHNRDISEAAGGSTHSTDIEDAQVTFISKPFASLVEMALCLLHSTVQSITVAVEKEEKQTAGSTISLSHQSIINDSAFSAWAVGQQPRLPRGHNWKIPCRCCRGHSGESRRGPRPPGPNALPSCASHQDGITRGASFTPPHLALCCPQPGVVARWPRALALGQPRSTTDKSLLNPTESS